ncbi:hypothetical protein [Amycolatopsis rifamycinica]|nr:hypothetical protein [Amycolatopsis rifamycinica]
MRYVLRRLANTRDPLGEPGISASAIAETEDELGLDVLAPRVRVS